MGKFTQTHEINCNADTFWKTFLDNNFNTALNLERLGASEFKVLENRETDQEVLVKSTCRPKMNMPGPVAKLFGSGYSQTLEGRLDKARKVWSFKIIPSSMADKIRQEGTIRVEPMGDGKVRRIAEIEYEAKIFGVGGLLESTSEKQIREDSDAAAVFMNQWVAQGKANS